MPRQKSLRQRLLLLFVAGLLPVSLLGAWGVWSAIDAQREELERSTLELSRALASTVESELEATLRELGALGRSRHLAVGDVRGFYDVARDEVAARPGWLSMILTDGESRVLFKTSAPYGSADMRIVDPVSLEQAMRTSLPVIGGVTPGQEQRPAFPARLPVFVDGRLAYVLTAAVKPDRILEVLNKQQVPSGWVIAVFDGANRRVARSQAHQVRAPSPTLLALLARSGEGGTGITRSLEGEEVQTGFTRIRDVGWTVAVGAPTSSTRAALLKSLAWYVAGAAASVLLCFALALRIANRISADIALLRDHATRLGEGRPVAVEHSEVEEVDQMGVALQAASERLRVTTESMREALARATAAGQAKDEFLAVLGHELRNPLAPMLTSLHLMDRKSDASTERERNIMRRQMAHMRRLVDDLLDVSRITRGKLEIRRESVNLLDVIDHALEAVQPAVQKRGRRVLVDLPSRPVPVVGDESRLVQAVTNLLANALAFAGSGDVSLSLRLEDATARIVVSDEGLGMAPETLARAFESFFQARQSIDRSAGGLGLGLAIVKTIVELHGGTVSAHSEGLGRGSTFEIGLPTHPSAAGAHAGAPMPGAGRAGRVLVVDDNVDALQTLAEVLRTAGHEVRDVSLPSEAIAGLGEFDPDVAILDIGLPEMDGYQLAAAMRRTVPRWSGKLVALTGYGQEADKARAADAGFVMHLTKPADPAELLAAVDSLLAEPSASMESAAPR